MRAAAIELADGRIVTGKTTDLFGPVSAAMLNALKALAGIPDEIKLISPAVIASIQTLKIDYMKSQNPRLHTDEMLVALSISAAELKNSMAGKCRGKCSEFDDYDDDLLYE